MFLSLLVVLENGVKMMSFLFSWMQNERPPLPSTCPRALRQLINRCWSKNPKKRPDFEEIVTILEYYSECIEEDEEFFTSHNAENHRGCLPSCF